MKKLFLVPVALLALASCGNKKTDNKDYKIETTEQKISYSVGYDVSRSLKGMKINIDPELFYKGVMDAMNDSVKPLMTNEEMLLAFEELKKMNMANMQQQQADMAAPNRAAGQQYAEEQMKTNPDMKKTNSGLIYQVKKEGSGKKPGPESTVRVKYTGALIDGTIFDQTGDNSTTFAVNQVIPGWTEGLQLMSEGAIYKLIIPAELAYNNNPPPNTPIQPGSTLVFDVELIKVEK